MNKSDLIIITKKYEPSFFLVTEENPVYINGDCIMMNYYPLI
jgi:hypothetical protein